MTASNKVPQDDGGMLLVTGADEQTTQLMMSNKVKRIATPDLLYLGMAMSKRLWGWQEMSETDWLDTVIYTLFNAAGITLGAAYIRETNKLVSFYEQPEKPSSESFDDHKIVTKPIPQADFDTSIDTPVAIKEKKNVVQAPWAEKKKNVDSALVTREAPKKEEADISIDTPIGAQDGEQIPWPEDAAKAEKKASIITASDVLSRKG